jgi:hypothetical protein
MAQHVPLEIPRAPPAAKVWAPQVLTFTAPGSANASALTVQIVMPPAQPEVWYESTAVWVGVLAFFGVVISLIVNHFKMKAEFVQESKEAHQERITEFRKEVYTKLIGDFTAAGELIGMLPNIDLDEGHNFAAKLSPLASSANLTWLVSEVETTRKARELHARVMELFMECATRLPPMQPHKIEIKKAKKVIEEAEAERVQLLTQVRHNANFNGGDVAVQAQLMAAKGLQERILAEHGAVAVEAEAERAKLFREYTEFMAPRLQSIMQGVQDFMMAARIEMGIAGDNGALQVQTLEMYSRMRKAVDDAMATATPQGVK